MVAVKIMARKSDRTRASSSATKTESNSPVAGNRRNSSMEESRSESLDSSPFFMHSADHPGLSITSLRLDDGNYDDWEAAMCIALDAKNKIGFINGSLPRPLESDPNFGIWSRCNSMVKSWILNSVSPQIYKSILRIKDASAIWKDLAERFHRSNLPRTFNLTQEIQDLKQGSMSLSEYYTSLKTLWANLDAAEDADDPCTCGKASRFQQKIEKERIVKFLAGLNDSYGVVRRQIIMKKVLPSLLEVYNILDQDDSQKNFNHQSPSSAFQVSKAAAFQVSRSSEENEEATVCYVSSGPNKGRAICSYCNKIGHTADKCYKKHGFPPGYSSRWKTGDKSQKFADKPLKPTIAQIEVTPKDDQKDKGIEGMIGNLTKDQIQDFIALFSTRLNYQATSSVNTTECPGSYQGVDDWSK